MREVAQSYRGNWRDIFLFLSAVMFTIMWWHVSHSRTNWLAIFILMIVLSVFAACTRCVADFGRCVLDSRTARRRLERTQRVSAEPNSSCIAIQCRCAAAGSYGALSGTAKPCPAG